MLGIVARNRSDVGNHHVGPPVVVGRNNQSRSPLCGRQVSERKIRQDDRPKGDSAHGSARPSRRHYRDRALRPTSRTPSLPLSSQLGTALPPRCSRPRHAIATGRHATAPQFVGHLAGLDVVQNLSHQTTPSLANGRRQLNLRRWRRPSVGSAPAGRPREHVRIGRAWPPSRPKRRRARLPRERQPPSRGNSRRPGSASQAALGNTFSELSMSRAYAKHAMMSSWVTPG